MAMVTCNLLPDVELFNFIAYKPTEDIVVMKPLTTEEIMRIAIMDADDKIVK